MTPPYLPLGFYGQPSVDYPGRTTDVENTIGPGGPIGAPATEPVSPWLSAYRAVRHLAGQAADLYGNAFLPGGEMITKGIKYLGEGVEQDVGHVADVVKNRNTPGAGSFRENLFNAVLPIAAGFYPIAGAEEAAARYGGKLTEEGMGRIAEAARIAAKDAHLMPGDRALMTQMREAAPDLSHYSDDDLAQELGKIDNRRIQWGESEGVLGNRTMEHLDPIQFAHDQAYAEAIHGEIARRNAPVPVAPNLGQKVTIKNRTQDLLKELGYDHSPSATPTPGGEGAESGGRQVLHEGMSKDEAVAKNREYATAGVPTEMRRQPDGTFTIIKKGAGAAKPEGIAERAAKPKSVAVEPVKKLTPIERALTAEEREAFANAQTKMDDLNNQYRNAGRGADRDRISNEYDVIRRQQADFEQRINHEETLEEAELPPELEAQARALQKDFREKRALADEENRTQGYSDKYYELSSAAEKSIDEADKIIQQGMKDKQARVMNEAAQRTQKYLTTRTSSEVGTAAPPSAAGRILGGGFQSRTISALENRYPDNIMTPTEWAETLRESPHVPNTEVESVLTPERIAELEAAHPEGISGSDLAKVFEKESPAAQLQRKVLGGPNDDTPPQPELPPLEVVEPEIDEDALWEAAQDRVRQERDEQMGTAVEDLANSLSESELEYWQEQLGEHIQTRDDALDEIHNLARSTFGDEAGDQFMSELRDLQILGETKDYSGNPIEAEAFPTTGELDANWTGKHFREFASDPESTLNPPIREHLDELLAARRSGTVDPAQLPLDAEQSSSLFGDLTGPNAEEYEPTFRDALERALAAQNEALDYRRREHVGDYDWEALREQAREMINDDPDSYARHLPNPDNPEHVEREADYLRDNYPNDYLINQEEFEAYTRELYRRQHSDDVRQMSPQFSQYQRINATAPYDEVLVYQPGAKIEGGHFTRAGTEDLVSHNRNEYHNWNTPGEKTAVMIEGQSDFVQRDTREVRTHGSSKNMKTPWNRGQRWVQMNTGASLRQAALRGADWFSWSTPANRVRRASLNAETAVRNYGQEVPKSIATIFEALDLPIESEKWTPTHTGTGNHDAGWIPEDGEFTRIRLTPEMRDKILSAGIPALGLAAAMVRVQHNGKGTYKKAAN